MMKTLIPVGMLLATGLTGAEKTMGQPVALPETVRTPVAKTGAETAPLPPDSDRVVGRKQLGLKKYRGRWMTAEQVAAQEEDARAQAKADREWEPRLRRWRSWLTTRARHDEAETALAELTDPRAVPSVWKVFATGPKADQRLVVQLLGQLEGASASRGLALLTISGESAEVRRVATETLRRRDPLEFADVLIDLIREPVQYEARPVEGPGRPGSVTVKGRLFNIEWIYAPPPPPPLAVFPEDEVRFDARGLPVLQRHTDSTGLPFVWVDSYGITYRSGAIIPPHVPVTIHLGEMWLENWKSARSAQGQLLDDVVAIEHGNELRRAANEQVVEVLIQTTGERLPVDRSTWRIWWCRKLGRTYTPDPENRGPTVRGLVPLHYWPRTVAGLGFDPVTGYYIRAWAFGW